jgi:hypothetical protein
MQTGLGDAFESFAMAGEDLNPQLLLQLNDGLGDAWLRGMQGLGCFGEVQVAASGFLYKSELMQVHNLSLYETEFS